MTNITIYDLGVIKLKDSVYVSDPCYSVGTWCQALVAGLKPGKYRGFMKKADTDWGRRVIDLWIAHEDTADVYPIDIFEEIEIGVDSGAAGIYDKEYYEKYHQHADISDDPESDAWYDNQFDQRYYYDIEGKEIKEKYDEEKGYFYTDQERRDGIALDEKCIISFSGFGDGGYDLYYSKDADGKIVSLRINFIREDDFEEDAE